MELQEGFFIWIILNYHIITKAFGITKTKTAVVFFLLTNSLRTFCSFFVNLLLTLNVIVNLFVL